MEPADSKVVEKGDFLKRKSVHSFFSTSVNVFYAVAAFILHAFTKGVLLGRL